MSYCVALRLEQGIVFAADTRTNAGVDNIRTFRKLHCWNRPDRAIVILTAGNLAVTQSVISLLNEQLEHDDEGVNLGNAPSMFRIARVVGDAVREVKRIDGPSLEASAAGFTASLILGGQIRGEAPRLFQIYAEGNFIESTEDTPFFQIGEHKYGKPILDRVARLGMRLGEAAKLVLLSFDSTVRSNLSVGLPIDILLYERDTLDLPTPRRIEQNDPYFQKLSRAWSDHLREAFARMEEFEF